MLEVLKAPLVRLALAVLQDLKVKKARSVLLVLAVLQDPKVRLALAGLKGVEVVKAAQVGLVLIVLNVSVVLKGAKRLKERLVGEVRENLTLGTNVKNGRRRG